jgi:hypothetical protein
MFRLSEWLASGRAPAKVRSFKDTPLGRYCYELDPETSAWWRKAKAILGDDLAQTFAGMQGSQRLNILPQSFLFSNNLDDFAAEFRGGISEVIHWPLFSMEAYATGGSTQIILFQKNVGGATNGLGDTNLQQQGMMAGGEAHVTMSLRVIPHPANADVFVTAGLAPALQQWYDILMKNCWLEMRITDKYYLQHGPIAGFPTGFGLGSIFSSTATASVQSASIVQSGHPSNMALYKFDPPLLILPSRTFNVSLNWKAANSVTTAGRIGAWLDGYRVRAVQ